MRQDLPSKREPRTSILKLGKSFELSGVKLPGFPCPLNSKGGLILPAVDYLSERAVYQRVSMGTLLQEAYILKDWFTYCEVRHRSWREPNDQFLHDWRIYLERRRYGRREQDPEAWSRNNRKISVVFHFYHLIQTTLHTFKNAVVGDPGRDGGVETPLTMILSEPEGMIQGGKPVVLHRVRYGNKPEVMAGRPTPRPSDVDAIILKASDRSKDFASSTHYLMARCMAQAGLRAIGVTGLSIRAIADGLLGEDTALHARGRMAELDLHGMARSWADRTTVLSALSDLEKRYRKHVFIKVTEKRQVTRSVAMPIGLVKELLGYVWDERCSFLATGPEPIRQSGLPDAIFISMKTGKAFETKSISNLVSEAFRKAEVAGSAHRLRAAYAEEVVRDAYLRARAVHGRNFDPESVWLLVREALGHKDFGTAKSYLNRILAEENLIPGQPVLVTREEHASSVRAFVDIINEGNPQAVVLLANALSSLGREPRREPSTIKDVRQAISRRGRAATVLRPSSDLANG